MLKKLKNSKGFTLSETMAAVLILALVITLTGGGVIVVKNAYQRITLRANAQVLLSTTITKVTDEFKYAVDMEEGTDNPYFINGNNRLKMSFTNDDSKGIMQTYKIGETNQTSSTALLTSKTMTDGLVPSISYSYSSSDKVFTATINVTKAGKDTPESTQKIIVRPMGQ